MPYEKRKTSLTDRWKAARKSPTFMISIQDIVTQVSEDQKKILFFLFPKKDFLAQGDERLTNMKRKHKF